MKKTILAIAAMAVMFGFAQCSKQPVQPHYTGYVGDLYVSDITFNATSNSSNSKVSVQSVSELLKLQWDNTDEIKVFNKTTSAEITNLNIKNGWGYSYATFDGTITAEIGTPLSFCYFGSGIKTEGEGRYETDFQNQSGELTKVSAPKGLSIMENLKLTSFEDLTYSEDGNYSATMIAPYAILYLDLSAFNNTTYPTEVLITSTGNPDVIVKNVTKDSKKMYVALPTNNPFGTENPEKVKYTFSCGGMGYTYYEWGINQNTYYTKKDGAGAAIVVGPGLPAIPGTIDPNNTGNFPAGGLNP